MNSLTVKVTVDDLVGQAENAGICLTPIHRVRITEMLNELSSSGVPIGDFCITETNNPDTDRFQDSPGAICLGYQHVIGPRQPWLPEATKTFPADRYQRQTFQRVILPSLALPRNIKSKLAADYYSGGLVALANNAERLLSGTPRIRTHLLAITTLHPKTVAGFAHEFHFLIGHGLYYKCRLLREALALRINCPLHGQK